MGAAEKEEMGEWVLLYEEPGFPSPFPTPLFCQEASWHGWFPFSLVKVHLKDTCWS